MVNGKAAAALIGTILLGTCACLIQEHRLQDLRAENQRLLAHQHQLITERETAASASRSARAEVDRLRRDNAELMRLRQQAAEREAAKPPDSPPNAGQPAAHPGRYIPKDQLVFAGYATPEAALQSVTWVMLNGTYEQSVASLPPDQRQSELNDPKGRERFETGRKTMAALFLGMQIAARKTLAEDRVELKFKLDVNVVPEEDDDIEPFLVQPMVKVGNEWKLGGSTINYDDTWEQDGEIQLLAR